MEKKQVLALWGKMISDTVTIGFLELKNFNIHLIVLLSAILSAVFLAGVAWICVVFSVALFFFHQGEPLTVIFISLAVFHILISAILFSMARMRSKHLLFPTTQAAIQTLLGKREE